MDQTPLSLNGQTWKALPSRYRWRAVQLLLARLGKDALLALKWLALGWVVAGALLNLALKPYLATDPVWVILAVGLYLVLAVPVAYRRHGFRAAAWVVLVAGVMPLWPVAHALRDGAAFERFGLVQFVAVLTAGIVFYFSIWVFIMDRALRIASDGKALEAFIKEGVGPQPVMAFPLAAEEAIQTIRQRVIGQDAIVEGAVRMVYRRGLMARKGRPLAVLMFVGATGAGKTELAKAMAETLFGKGFLIEVPCNQFNESHHLDGLLGAPPGYRGCEQGGVLTRQIARLGRGVLLFDEIEKAHPDLLRVIMTLLDEGKITERSTGNVADATRFVIVLTSNARQAEIAQIVATVADPEDCRQKVRAELVSSGTFAPEQMARIDEIYPFGRLDRAALLEIVALFLERFGEQCGVRVVEADTELLIDLVLQAEQRVAEGGVRDVVRAVEQRIIDGLLDVRMRGERAAAIRIREGRVVVEARRTW